MNCDHCMDTGTIYEVWSDGEVVEEGCRGCRWCEESEEDARARMTETERAADRAFDPLSMALDEGQTHAACPLCAGLCHCHYCSIGVLQECDRLRAEVKRWQAAFRGYAVHDDARCEYFGKCQCGLDELVRESNGEKENTPAREGE